MLNISRDESGVEKSFRTSASRTTP